MRNRKRVLVYTQINSKSGRDWSWGSFRFLSSLGLYSRAEPLAPDKKSESPPWSKPILEFIRVYSCSTGILSFRKFVFLGIFCFGQHVYSNPTEPTVIAGTIDMRASTECLQIHASDRTIIDWATFSISDQELTEFLLPGRDALIVNRVIGSTRSDILGRLHSNGQVYLINPNGILIGPDGRIETASFLASTLNLLDEDTYFGKEWLFQGSSSESITNLGTICCPQGNVFLLAAQIDNQGSLIAQEGFVGLASGSRILIQPERARKIYIQSEAVTSSIEHAGFIESISSEISTYGAFPSAIRLSGKINAFDLAVENGRVFIKAQEGKAEISGHIFSPGGEVVVLGEEVHLTESACIDVASSEKAGQVILGRNERAECATQTFSRLTRIDSGAKIFADHLNKGIGGCVIIGSEEQTYFQGKITACGNQGGFVEVSSQGTLCYAGLVDLRGTVPGTLLLDPKNLTITPLGGALVGNQFFSDNPSGTSLVSGAMVSSALDLANVFLQANTDLTIDDTIAQTMGNGNLFLQAGRSIIFSSNGQITMQGRSVSATINDAMAIMMDRDPGDASFTMPAGSFITTNGGNVDIICGSYTGMQEGYISLTGGNIIAGGGNIVLTGINFPGMGLQQHGISVTNVSQISTTGSGTITFTGVGGSQTGGQCHGINISDMGTLISSVDGDISFTGTGGSEAMSDANFGVALSVSAQLSTSGSGSVILAGTGGSAANSNYGIYISNSAAILTSGSGGIDLTGSSNGNGVNNAGIMFENAMTLNTVDGPITLDGTGGTQQLIAMSPGSPGVRITPMSVISSTNGTIQIQGVGGNGAGDACSGVENVGLISTMNSAISIIGTGGACRNGSTGIVASGIIETFSDNQSISLIGTGGPSATGDFGFGLAVFGSVLSHSANPLASSIVLQGTGSGGGSVAVGILCPTMTSIIQTQAGSVSLTGTGGNGSGMQNGGVIVSSGALSTGSGNLSISAFGGQGSGLNAGFVLNSSASVSTVDGQIQINTSSGSATSEALIIGTAGIIQSTNLGSIQIVASGGDIALNDAATIQAFSGAISVTAAGSVDLTAGPLGTDNPVIQITDPATSNPMLLIAGTNISLVSVPGGGTAEISHGGTGNLTLVCDNLFPTAPGIGTGAFSISSILSANGELRIYTASPAFNQINDLINGQAFIPGAFGVNSTSETWETYYPLGSYGGGAFNFYYKVGLEAVVIANFGKLLIAQAQLGDNLPLLYIHYYLQFCYENEKHRRFCNPDLDKIFLRKPFYHR